MLTAMASRLRRVTNGRPWIPEIDGLRFIAIAGVVLFHMYGELASRSGHPMAFEPRYWPLALALGNGDRGVRLFFVISGLVLALPFVRHFLADARPVSLRSYYMRRLTRLEPPYIASVAICVIAYAAWAHGMNAWFLQHAIASLLYLHGPIYGETSPVNMVTWSLEVEVQFYLVAPAIMQVFRIRNKVLRRLSLLAIIGLCAGTQVFVSHSARLFLSIARYLGYFVAGLLSADVFVLELPAWRERSAWDGVALGCGVAILGFNHDSELAHAVLPLLMAAVCIAVMRGPVVRRCLATPWVAVIGGMCYSIYLLHMTVIAVVFKLTKHLIVHRFDFVANYFVQAIFMAPAVLATGMAFYLLIERPCMDPQWPLKLKQWFLSRGGRSAAVASRS